MNATEQAQIAKQHSIEFPDKPVWVYQYGLNTYGFRFAELPKSEKGLLIACFYRGKSVTPKQAQKVGAN